VRQLIEIRLVNVQLTGQALNQSPLGSGQKKAPTFPIGLVGAELSAGTFLSLLSDGDQIGGWCLCGVSHSTLGSYFLGRSPGGAEAAGAHLSHCNCRIRSVTSILQLLGRVRNIGKAGHGGSLLDTQEPTPDFSDFAGDLVQLGWSRTAGLEQAQEGDVGPHRDPGADQGFAIGGKAMDGPAVTEHEVHQDRHCYGRAISAKFSGSVVFMVATRES
jgi:hypothetical protein